MHMKDLGMSEEPYAKRDGLSDACCLQHLFEAQARNIPDAIALEQDGRHLTYGNLDRRANQLAHLLRACGVGAEIRVGICLERSIEIVIAFLAVLKAGGAYVPLDPVYPRERLQYMAEDAELQVLLTHQELAQRFALPALTTICLDAQDLDLEKQSASLPAVAMAPDNLAYVIYTSGSTGRPKGVLIEHQALVNHNYAVASVYALQGADRVLQFASFSFDVAAEELYPAFLVGATVVLHTARRVSILNDFLLWVNENAITVLNLPASYWHEWVDTFASISCPVPPTLRLLIIGSEQVTLQRYFAWQEMAAGKVHFCNAYGPTETTITATIYPVPQFIPPAASVPIGRPINQLHVWILDAQLRPVPAGSAGELYIGGLGLSRGYLGRPDLTAERFLPHPFDSGGARLYKTGDLVRLLPDSSLEFLGRIDHQVKIRGFRIELGEVEVALRQHHAVREAIVLIDDAGSPEKRLLAFIVPHLRAEPSATELRLFLRERLPEYMLPALFLILDALPLTPSAKIDQRALLAFARTQAASDEAFAAPRTTTEQILAEIWSDVLSLERVGIDANFFALGGHSLAVTRVMARVRAIFGAELPLESLFSSPTIREFAVLLPVDHPQIAPARDFPIQPAPYAQDLPLSFAQERVWMIQQLAPETIAYTAPAILHIEGELHVEVLERCFTELIARHAVLRTTFPLVAGRPVQRIHALAKADLRFIDLQALAPWERQAEAQRLQREELGRPFDITRLPLLRLTLLRINPQEYHLLLVEHHMVHDGWSTNLLLAELLQLYPAFLRGEPVSLPPLPIQFADFAYWQHQWIQEEEAARHLAFWKEKLAASPILLNLPTDHPRPAVQRFRGAAPRVQLTPQQCEMLQLVCQQEGVTLFMVLLSCFLILLQRYSGQDDICVGSGIANRRWREMESVVGMVINTIVLRNDLSGNPTCKELLARVRHVTLEASLYQDFPFDKIVEALQPERSLSYNPLFQVMFGIHDAPMPDLELPGLSMSLLEAPANGSAKFDMNIIVIPRAEGAHGWHVREVPRGITLLWEYNIDLFEAATIERMIGHYLALLDAMLGDLGQHIAALHMLGAEEYRRLYAQWDKPQRYFPARYTLPELFEVQVARRPDAVALVFEEQQLSYSEISRHAQQLACYIQDLGIGPHALVGVYLERTPQLVIAILGVLMAGAAYVPLDPAYPAERVNFVLRDAQIPLLLTQQALARQLSGETTRLLCLDTAWQSMAPAAAERPLRAVSPEEPAYVIYTSGSTGRPKGVLVSHYNVARLFAATEDWYHFDERDIWTLFHSAAFDFSVWELWGALLHGGRLVVIPYLMSRSPLEFYHLLGDEGVTVLNQTPSAFGQLMRVEEMLRMPLPLSLRLVIFGGEALDPQRLQPWFERHGERYPQLINMYGITETTVHVTYRPLSLADTHGGSVIGAPLPDLQLYVLDQYQQLVPIGVPGELYVGGAGVAAGYLNRAELTRERFIVNPFQSAAAAPTSSDRLYRSGDLVRWLPNGDLEYLGRIDQQVKIRGFRIELGEVEAALNLHPAILEALVVVQEDPSAEKRLIAYMTTHGSAPQEGELRDFLLQHLPAYMLPAAFIFLEAFPLTPNGKVDRLALPMAKSSPSEESYVAPHTEREQLLARVWSQVLNLERVGIYANFFHLGGDSIRSIQVLAGVRELGWDFSLQDLFRHQRIFELAQKLVPVAPQQLPRAGYQPFSLLQMQDRIQLPPTVEDAYPLVRLQMGMFYHSEYSPASTLYLNVSSHRLRAPFDLKRFQTALRLLAERHPVLRLSFDFIHYSEPLQLIHREVEMPLWVVDLRLLPIWEQEKILADWFEEQKAQKFDWTQAPLIRFTLHLLSSDTFQLGFAEHHAILDGWSVASMLTELIRIYAALLHEEIVLPPPPESTFGAFVALERATLAQEAGKVYWREKLRDCTVLQLPRRPLPPGRQQSPHTRIKKVLLTPTLSEGIKRLAQLADVPVRSVVLAAHLRVLALLSNQTDILTGVVANGRPETRDAERTLGLFLNTIPFRLHVSGGSWLDLVRATFSAEQEILPYRRYPLADIQRLLGGGSLFETLFSFNHFHVYQGMQRLTSVELLESTFFEETNFTLAANFGQEVATSAVKLELDYDASILHEEQLEAIASYYLNTLTAMVNVPSARYEIQVLLPEHEMDVVLWRGHQAAELRAESSCLHQLFEAQVERAPDAAALVHAGHTLSYHRLNQLANQLAAFLQMSGVGPEVLVGVCLPRGFDWVVALLAVLKAGGVYVPLDPSYPEERLSWMVQDACLTLVLTQRPYMQRLPHSQARLVLLDEDERCWSQASAFSPRGSVAGENAAYLIYTSGSTGVPKGVLLPHKAIATHIALLTQRCALQATDRLLQFSALNFDVAMEELFSALGSGATCILSPFAALSTLPDFQHLLADEAVTVLNLPASYWHEWVAYCSSYSLHISSYVREVIVGSEAVAPRYFSDWQRLQSHPVRLFNAYGLTETTITTLMYEPESEYSYEEFSSIPLGYPLLHSQVYLLDVHLQPVPLGVVGEIYIGGTGVARGYLRHPELTAERFLPHPFSTQPGARVYKTGDLARYLPDGSLLFVGRSDLQLKLRGFRIEPAEIEAMLQLHSALYQAVVMVRTDTDGQQHLVAYLVAARQSSPPPPVSAISQFLAERLPSYLLPSAYVWLEELPLTPNGKIDRRALAQLTARSAEHPSVSATYVPPQNTLEAQLLQIWQKVLHVERIGMQDNFFELGGHSLLLVQLHSRLKHELGQQVSILELFEYPTIRALAAHFKRKGAEPGVGQGKKRGEARRAAVQQQTDLRQSIARSGNEGR